jgi:hypothetical protein
MTTVAVFVFLFELMATISSVQNMDQIPTACVVAQINEKIDKCKFIIYNPNRVFFSAVEKINDRPADIPIQLDVSAARRYMKFMIDKHRKHLQRIASGQLLTIG